MVQDPFLQAAARITVMVRDRHSARSIPRREFGFPSALPPGAVFGAPSRPKCRLPKSLGLAPSSASLLRYPRWLVAGCLPSRCVAKFEPRVLYGRGPAQVGFGVVLSSFHRLTLSSGGKLSPEPLRLTRPFGAENRGSFPKVQASNSGAAQESTIARQPKHGPSTAKGFFHKLGAKGDNTRGWRRGVVPMKIKSLPHPGSCSSGSVPLELRATSRTHFAVASADSFRQASIVGVRIARGSPAMP